MRTMTLANPKGRSILKIFKNKPNRQNKKDLFFKSNSC